MSAVLFRKTFLGLAFALLPIFAVGTASAEPLPPLKRRLVYLDILQSKTGFIHVGEGDKRRPEWEVLPKAKIVSVHGRSSNDVYLLTEEGVLLREDGKRIVDKYTSPCTWGNFNKEYNYVGERLFLVIADKDAVHVIGENRGINSRVGSELHAALGKDGKWTCKNEHVVPMEVVSNGDITWTVAHNMDGDLCRVRSSTGFCTSGPRWAPSFSEPVGDSIDMGIHSWSLHMFGIDDGYIITKDDTWRPSLHRFNGVTWAPITTIEAQILSSFADEDKNLWFLTKTSENYNDPGNEVRLFDGKALKTFPVPATFAAQFVRGTGPRDVWFAGYKNKIYQWDGSVLREGALNFEPTDVWAAPHGEVWFAGPEGIAFTAPMAEGK